MDETRELRFKKAINELTKSDKSIMLMLDGKVSSLKDEILDKLLDQLEPSRYELFEYDGYEKFIVKPFWQHSSHKHKIIIFDGSYKQIWKHLSKENMKEIRFFESQMAKYGFPIISYKFKEDKTTKLNYREDRNQTYCYGEDKNEVFDMVIDDLTNQINALLSKPLEKIEPISSIGPSLDISHIKNEYTYNEDNWKELQKYYQKEVRKLHEKLIDEGKSVLIVFQGIDGAGKSSSIRRLTEKMVPHWFNVYGFGAPTTEELDHHYLWRFWTKLPEPGEITVFDRSYFERLTAERVLKLNNNGWINSVEEINEFERELQKNNIKIVKFWFNIDKDTQAERFKERQENPLKTWKISKADFETREKWDEYQIAFKEMLGSTNSEKCPWFLIDSRNKREARIEALSILVREMKKFIKED